MRQLDVRIAALAANFLIALVPFAPTNAAGDGGTGGDAQVTGSYVGGDPTLAPGQRALDAGDWQDAAEKFERAIESGSPSANAYNLLAYSHRRLGQLDLAFSNYAQALELDPRHRGAHEYIGEAYLLIGDPDQAAIHLNSLKEICRNCSEAMKLRKALARHKRTTQTSMLAANGEAW
ncbi:MAG: tetratricopeptide repeat protein [Proteobacteria bacterium]|nr:tetratricopeptide repeat protein [Pseudomonadota bacterium]MDA1354939.1 tetratricopeptide repeat protein [Pseudomonadota bacterium]